MSEANYLDNSKRSDRLSGGVRRIPISTAHGDFKVWTKRIGNFCPVTRLMRGRSSAA